MSDLEKAQEVLRAWRLEADGKGACSLEPSKYINGIWRCRLWWVDGEQQVASFGERNPLTAVLKATQETPWPQSVPEGSE